MQVYNFIKKILEEEFHIIQMGLVETQDTAAHVDGEEEHSILGGIADRYFVAPMTLSWLASALLLRQMTVTIPLVGKLLVVTALLLFLVPTVKWFRAGWYLTSGRTWSDQIYDARYFCDTFKIIDFEVSFSPHGTERYECTFLEKDK